jgi:hypothetical protein
MLQDGLNPDYDDDGDDDDVADADEVDGTHDMAWVLDKKELWIVCQNDEPYC